MRMHRCVCLGVASLCFYRTSLQKRISTKIKNFFYVVCVLRAKFVCERNCLIDLSDYELFVFYASKPSLKLLRGLLRHPSARIESAPLTTLAVISCDFYTSVDLTVNGRPSKVSSSNFRRVTLIHL